MRVLVTGATGLIGRRLIERLGQSAEVFAVARGEPGPQVEGVQWLHQDLTEALDHSVLPGAVDGVVHLAQSERYRDFPDGAEDIFAVNVHSTFRLLEYARAVGAQHFVLASTGGIYGYRADPIDESTPLAPSSPYFRSKRIAELLLDDYGAFFAGVALRFFFVYGAGPGRGLVSRVAQQLLADEEIVIEGRPGVRLNPIYVDDAAAAIEAGLGLGASTTVNVAGAEVVDLTELVEMLAAELGREARIRHDEGGEPAGDMVSATTRMRDELGVLPATALKDGLRLVADSLVGQPG
jgi:nucleoside-diphosphate-sugar epimerase